MHWNASKYSGSRDCETKEGQDNNMIQRNTGRASCIKLKKRALDFYHKSLDDH